MSDWEEFRQIIDEYDPESGPMPDEQYQRFRDLLKTAQPSQQDKTTKALNEIIAAIEKQTGQKVEYYTVCSSFEDSPDFQHIANIGISTPCEEPTCNKAMCMEHSYDAISECGYDAYACVHCSTETEFQL